MYWREVTAWWVGFLNLLVVGPRCVLCPLCLAMLMWHDQKSYPLTYLQLAYFTHMLNCERWLFNCLNLTTDTADQTVIPHWHLYSILDFDSIVDYSHLINHYQSLLVSFSYDHNMLLIQVVQLSQTITTRLANKRRHTWIVFVTVI